MSNSQPAPISGNVINHILYLEIPENNSRHVDKCCTAGLGTAKIWSLCCCTIITLVAKITFVSADVILKVAVITSSLAKITFVVAQIPVKVALITSSVVKIIFVVAEITFKMVVITSCVVTITLSWLR